MTLVWHQGWPCSMPLRSLVIRGHSRDNTMYTLEGDCCQHEFGHEVWRKLGIKIGKGYARHYSFLKEQPIIVPSRKETDKFECMIRILFEQISHNRIESLSLSKQRDELLPLLKNGQVSPLNCDWCRHLRLRLGIVTPSFPSALASRVNSDL